MQSMCRDDDDGCHRGFHVALAGDSFGLLEEGTHVYFTRFNFGKSVEGYCIYIAFKAAEKYLSNTPKRLILPVLRKHVFKFSKIESGWIHCAKPACKV